MDGGRVATGREAAAGQGRAARPGPWWRDAVVYEVYPRSFCDADGDGEGDLAGLVSRLPYLLDLGVDALWLTPWYPSPMADGGYDVADYRDIDPRYGTLADADRLLDQAHDVGLRVIVDLVANHTSQEHPWFAEALASEPDSPARARYFFRDGRQGGQSPPNDWISAFGGPAWTRLTTADGTPGQWYLHLFSPEQPDLDWSHQDVVAEFDGVLEFWLDRGVDGIRVDAAPAMAKDPQLPDAGHGPDATFDTRSWVDSPHWDRPEVHDIFRRWRQIVDRYDGQRILVSESVIGDPERLAAYVRPDEMHQTFNFDLIACPWDHHRIDAAVRRTLDSHAAVGALPTWVLSSHDETRHLTRFTPDTSAGPDHVTGRQRARAAVLLLLGLPGSAYVYQGEELGLEEVTDLPDATRQDPIFHRSGGTVRGRDGCRVPLPWSGSGPPFGFGPEGSRPWLPQPQHWGALTAQVQTEDPRSVLSLYSRATRWRRRLSTQRDAELQWLDLGAGVLAFAQGRFSCVVNIEGTTVVLPEHLGDVVLHSEPDAPLRSVGPSQAAWLLAG